MAVGIDVERLGRRLRRFREEKGLTLKDVFNATDISVASLSRIERGASKDLDAGTFTALAKWMGIKSDEFRRGAKVRPAPPGGTGAESTPEAVELYLRADKNLDERAASLLAEMFRAAYDRLSKEDLKKE